MQITPGSIVRPVISIAGLDARKQYRVANVERTPFYSLAWLEREDVNQFHLVENAHVVLEVVSARSVTPVAVDFN